MKGLLVHLDIWKWDGVVLVGGTSTDFTTYAKAEHNLTIESNEFAMGHAYVQPGTVWLLWVTSLDDLAALAHEALHVVSGILESRGLTHDGASEEAYTYTMEYIIRTTLTAKAREWQRIRR